MGHAEVILEHLAKAGVNERQREAGLKLAEHVALIHPLEDISADYEWHMHEIGREPTYLMRDILSFEQADRGPHIARTVCEQLGLNVDKVSFDVFRNASIAFRERLGQVYGGPGV